MEVQKNDICSPFISHQCCHSVVESHQVGQAELALGETMLAVPNHLTLFRVPQQSSCSMILPGTGVRITGRLFPGSSFLPFLKMVQVFPISSHLELYLITMIFQISWRVTWQLHQPIPQGLWDASLQVSQTTYVHMFKQEVFCPHSPHPSFHPFERCRKRVF